MSSLFGGGGNTTESSASILQAMEKHFPRTAESIRTTYGPEAEAQYQIAKQYSPLFAQLQAELMGDEGMKLAEVGRELSRQEQLGAARTELEIAQGPGRELAKEALALESLVDPEYFKGRETLLGAIEKSLGAVDPSRLTPGETESIARGLGRTNYAVGSPTQDAMSAMTFGDALSKRRSEFNSAIDRAIGGLPAMRSGLSGYQAATGRNVMPNFGNQNYTGVQTPGVQTSQTLGQQQLNNLSSIEGARVGKQKDWMDLFGGFTSGVGNMLKISKEF